MASYKDQGRTTASYQDPGDREAAAGPHLEPGELIQHLAYGQRPPPWWATFILAALDPSGSALWRAGVHYLVVLTDRRFVVLRFKGKEMEIVEVCAWPLTALPPVKTSAGGALTNIALSIEDSAHPFKMKLMPGQRETAEAIAAALTETKAAA